MSNKPIERRRLQTPQGDRSVFIEPSLDHVRDLVDGNLRIRDQLDCDLHGRSLAEISRLARTELLDAARRWTSAYRNIPTESPGGLIYLAGHQPQMFHPGVWFKNFALGHMAKRHGATAVNLIIDNDVLSDASLPVPSGTVFEPRVVRIPFDRPDPKIPYEERRIEDRDIFAGFARNVVEKIASLVANPLISQYWSLVRSRAAETDKLGACLAQARHQLEGLWGLDTLEVPESCVCAGEAFWRFVVHLLARLSEFRAVHNEAVQEYRRVHRIRSVLHPVPELAEQEDWQEAPFWVWTAADPYRRRLFSRSTGDEIILADRRSWEARLPLRAAGDADRAVEKLLHLQYNGVRIRSRALTTTLWARLALGDLFMHGIGGAKYDQVTDQIIQRFFGFQPPGFMIVSATLLPPIEREGATEDDARTVRQELRDMSYHPERYLDNTNDATADLIATKRRWIETQPTVENARHRCHAIRDINAKLQLWLAEWRQRTQEHQTRISQKLQAEGVLGSREYAFCLYPESTLRSFLSGLLHKTA